MIIIFNPLDVKLVGENLEMFRSLPVEPRHLWKAAALSLTFGLFSCGEAPQSGAGNTSSAAGGAQLSVVATTNVLCDLTEQIAQDTVALTCLLEPGQDPHVYRVTPADRRALEEADLVLYGGYDLEPELIQLIEASNNPSSRVAVYEAAVTNPLMGEAHDHDHDHDHGHEEEAAASGHSHDHDDDHDHGESAATNAPAAEGPVPDPHVWHDARNGAEMVAVIQEQLEQLSPENAELYSQNAEAIANQLIEIDGWIRTQTATIPASQRRLVTTHDALRYYAEAYDFTVKGALSGLSTEERPSAGQMTSLVNLVKSAEVPAVFAEESTNRQLIEAVARDADATVPEQALFIETLGGPGSNAETYQQMLVTNTCTIVDALGGQCSAEEAPL